MKRIVGTMEMIAAVLLGFVAIVTFTEAVLRYGFGMRIPDAFTIATMSQGMAIAWGIASTTYARSHITVDILWEVAPPSWRKIMDVVAGTITIAAFAVLSFMMCHSVLLTHRAMLVSNDLMMPMWPLYLMTAAGIVCATLAACLRVAVDIRERRS